MRCPTLSELPPSPSGKSGWPWTEETPQLPDTTPDGTFWPKISIVTPSYNQAHFIEETIRAILLQGYPNLQYVVSEDCSTDNTLEVVGRYEPWLELIVGEQNRGMSHAINKGFGICDGDIVTWISSDDVYLPGAFAEVARHWLRIQRKGYGVAVGGFQFMDADSRIEPMVHRPRLPSEGPLDLSLLSPDKWRLHQVATFYTRRALDDVGRYVREEIRHNPDREILYRITLRHPVLTLPKALAAFRIHDHSKSGAVANVMPMAEEYAAIQQYFYTESASDNRRRDRIAGYRVAKGYIKLAKYTQDRRIAFRALLMVLQHSPTFLRKRGFWIALAEALRIRGPLLAAKKYVANRNIVELN